MARALGQRPDSAIPIELNHEEINRAVNPDDTSGVSAVIMSFVATLLAAG